MPSKDKRKLAAIMFADVVGYSRMMASNEERTLELLKDFENICSPIISKHDGEIIKKVGDELFCEFSSAKQAVDSALAIQKAIQPYNDSRPKDFILQVRIGIHLGDIVLRDGDVFGDGVNVASRIQPLANPGGISISGAVNDTISNHSGYEIRSKGKQELKNILQKHSIYEVITGNEIFVNKINSNNNLFKNKYSYIICIISIVIVSILYYFIKGNEIYELSNNKELSVERSNIIIPFLSSRSDLIPILEKLNSDIEFSSLNNDTLSIFYNELIKKVKTNFYPKYNVYENNDIVKSFESIGKTPPDLDSGHTFIKAFLDGKIDDYFQYLFDDDKKYGLNDNNPIEQIIQNIDNNILSQDLLVLFYIYKMKLENDSHNYQIFYTLINRRDFISVDSVNYDISLKNIQETSEENLICDLIGIIYKELNKTDDINQNIKSVEKDKVFVQINNDANILSNTEYEVEKYIELNSIESIQNHINEINLFIECCNEKEDIDKDINCLMFYNNDLGRWNKNELIILDSLINNFANDMILDDLSNGFNTKVLINEVYDSIAVGNIIDYNENSCIKVLPGDILIPIK